LDDADWNSFHNKFGSLFSRITAVKFTGGIWLTGRRLDRGKGIQRMKLGLEFALRLGPVATLAPDAFQESNEVSCRDGFDVSGCKVTPGEQGRQFV
jgi:hypothetical protein